MKRSLTIILLLTASVALAAGPIATPADGIPDSIEQPAPPGAGKAFGDPTDWLAAALAGADYLVAMQSDITEDNAGNGDPDQDPEDGGWDWTTFIFEHSANASATNIYGSTGGGLYEAYLLEPKTSYFTAMKDAADHIVAVGPTVIRSSSDIAFLVDFASLDAVADPTPYLTAAEAIWTYRLANYGDGTATGFGEWLRDWRAGSYQNGIIPYDLNGYVQALLKLDAAVPGQGYADDADDIAEVMWQDSFNTNPGYFDPNGDNKGFDPDYINTDFYWYTIGVANLLEAFDSTGLHTSEIPGLLTLLDECQYDDGAFSYQYGASTDFNDRTWQGTAFAVMALHRLSTPTAATQASIRDAATWTAEYQDPSGGWLYSDGKHYPQMGGENTVALAYGWLTAGAEIGVSFDGPDPATCGLTKIATVRYIPGDATPGIRGFEVVFEVTGGVNFDRFDVHEGPALDSVSSAQFYAVDNGDGTFTASGAILGATPGLLAAGDLFTVDLETASSGPVAFDILSVDLRDPDNTPLFADFTGASFTVDCDAPDPVTGITADPANQEVLVTWTHDDVGVARYAIFRGLWYDTTPGVSAYPEYDDFPNNTIPTRPVDYADALASLEWLPVDTVTVGTHSYLDTIAPRGVYYYEVFAIDAAGNVSDEADANDRATNYWLGDFNLDGVVDIADVSLLGDSFGLSDVSGTDIDDDWDNDTFIDNTQDVGPTDDNSSFGIPETDNQVQFEDLIIVAINFGEVSAKALPTVTGHAQLAWTQIDESRWALDLVDGHGLQGLRVQAAVPVTAVTAGDLLADQDAPVFLKNVGSNLDANLATLGRGAGIVGTGRLLVVTTGAAIDTDQLTIDARDLANNPIEVMFSQATSVEVPEAFQLGANYPNPFNPQTTISFALPQAETVRLAIYSLDGRLVRTLINGERQAGNHDVTWNGRDDAGRAVATGTYMYVIDAGDHHQTRKMSLIK